jgi:Uma2 family endonuclease
VTTIIDRTMAAPSSIEFHGPTTRVPTLEELERLTAVPEQRVVYRNVDWSFYERLVDSIPQRTNIHVDYDGKDLEVMGKGRKHEGVRGLLRRLVETVSEELGIPCNSVGETTWKRIGVARGLEADECYYFLPEKMAADAAARARNSDDIADYPNPDLAIEVDISPPQVDRASIYAALRVTEVWRFVENVLVIERLTGQGTYVSVETSGFLPVTASEVRRWVVDERSSDDSAWARRLRAEVKSKKASEAAGNQVGGQQAAIRQVTAAGENQS